MRGARPRLLLVATFLCVAAVHVWMVWMAPNALSFSPESRPYGQRRDAPDGQAHARQKGEFPIFYYGQDWFGSLPAVVYAAVFLALGGIPPWSIHGPSLLFFLGWCVVLYLLARDTLGPGVALMALAWNIVTPVALSEYDGRAHGELCGGPGGDHRPPLAGRTRGPGPRGAEPERSLCPPGVCRRPGWWTTPLVIYSLLAAAVYIVMRERIAAVVKGALISLPAFFVGMAPVFYFYATESALLEGTDPYSRVLGMVGEHSWSDVPSGLLPALVRARAAVPRLGSCLGHRFPFGDWFAAAVYSLGDGVLSVAPAQVVRRAQPAAGRRRLADLLCHLQPALRRQHPHPTRRASVRDSALRAPPRGPGVLAGARAPHLEGRRRGGGCAGLFLIHGWGRPCPWS